MAENPATWGEAEEIVDRVLEDYSDPEVCGLSTVRRITDALRDAGFCLERHTGGYAPGAEIPGWPPGGAEVIGDY
jgi:hypothetical protein